MKKIMSYLKIFPRSIAVKIDGAGDYVGRLTYDFEQYGRMVYDDGSDISLQCRWQPHSNWLIQSTGQVHNLAGFFVFIKALNHYLFEMVQFDPISQLCKTSSAEYKYYFERVYFDMGTGQFVSAKKIPVVNSGEAARDSLKLNIRS
jgi:hypothetical protein